MTTTPDDEPTTVRHLLIEALMTDGAHHKQWYLERIAEALGISLHDYEYDPGIAP